jgi:TetR/AcrR family transcriptional regulator, cholesterol catabolism regulator
MMEPPQGQSLRPSPPTAPEVSSLTKSQALRRTRIVETAFELLLAQPYEKIQMRDIADAAGVALGTLYRYFSSKELLFSFVSLKWADRLDERVHRRPLQGHTNGERLTELFGRSMHSFEMYPQFFDSARVISSSNDPPVMSNVNALAERASGIYHAALVGVPSSEAATIVLCCQALMDWLLKDWYRGRIPMEEARRRMGMGIDLMLRSIDYPVEPSTPTQ